MNTYLWLLNARALRIARETSVAVSVVFSFFESGLSTTFESHRVDHFWRGSEHDVSFIR